MHHCDRISLSDEDWCVIYHKEDKLDSRLNVMIHSAITVLADKPDYRDVVLKVIE